MHYEIDFGTWDTPDKLHQSSTLYIQRGKDGYAKREQLEVPASDMFLSELELFAESCRSRQNNELCAHNGNVAVAMVYGALRSLEEGGRYIKLDDVVAAAKTRISTGARHVA